MEKKDLLKKKTEELLKEAAKFQREHLEKFFKNNCQGMIDFESYDGSYAIPKAIISALFVEESRQYTPLAVEGRKLKDNISMVI